ASWGPDDQILFVQQRGILQVPGAGGTPKVVVARKGGDRLSSPQLLPGGEFVLFILYGPGATVEQGQVVAQKLGTSERHVLVEGARDVRYLTSGHLLYSRGNTLLAQATDPRTLTLSGEPVPVLDGVANAGATSPAVHFAVSSTGTLLYVPSSSGSAT